MRWRPLVCLAWLLLCIVHCTAGAYAYGCGSMASVGAELGGRYATLLYDEEFLAGVRVLGASLKASGARYDMLVLVTDKARSRSCSLF